MTNSVKISRTHVLAGCLEYTSADNEDAFDRHVYAIYPNCIRRIARVGRYTRQMLKMRRRSAGESCFNIRGQKYERAEERIEIDIDRSGNKKIAKIKLK